VSTLTERIRYGWTLSERSGRSAILIVRGYTTGTLQINLTTEYLP